MRSNDLQYFRRRAEQERQRAATAADPNSRAVHLDMARRYRAATATVRDAREVEASFQAIDRSRRLLARTSKLIGQL